VLLGETGADSAQWPNVGGSNSYAVNPIHAYTNEQPYTAYPDHNDIALGVAFASSLPPNEVETTNHAGTALGVALASSSSCEQSFDAVPKPEDNLSDSDASYELEDEWLHTTTAERKDQGNEGPKPTLTAHGVYDGIEPEGLSEEGMVLGTTRNRG
jgi:hypothetical protein